MFEQGLKNNPQRLNPELPSPKSRLRSVNLNWEMPDRKLVAIAFNLCDTPPPGANVVTIPAAIGGNETFVVHRVEWREKEIFIDHLLVRLHFVMKMLLNTGLAPRGSAFPFPGSLTSTLRGGGATSFGDK